jgi:hypothetical protein
VMWRRGEVITFCDRWDGGGRAIHVARARRRVRPLGRIVKKS